MSELKNLVPPLELCKLIPDGEFRESALGYHRYCIKDGKEYYEVVQRGNTHSLTDVQYPAPTLQEIMADMQYCRVYKKTANFFVAVKEKDRVASFNAATAAMKLWLKLKGIEYANVGTKGEQQ